MKFGGKERLKSNQRIKALFLTGKVVKSFPLTLRYLPKEESKMLQVAVTVSKRKFKRAVDRNAIKRQLRAVIREGKSDLQSILKPGHDVLLIYTGVKKVNFEVLKTAFEQVLERIELEKMKENE